MAAGNGDSVALARRPDCGTPDSRPRRCRAPACLPESIEILVANLWRKRIKYLKLNKTGLLPKQNVAGSIPVSRSSFILVKSIR